MSTGTPHALLAAPQRPSRTRLAVGVAVLVGGTTVASAGVLALLVAVAGWDAVDRGPTHPGYLLTATLVVPLVWVAISAVTASRVLGIHPATPLSVDGRFRWSWYARCAGVAAVLGAAVVLVQDPGTFTSGAPVAGWPLLVAIVVVCVPFQAFAEEYAYRGVLTVAIGSRFTHRTAGVLVPATTTSLLFALVHPRPNAGLLLLTVTGGLVYSGLTHLTGGIEAASAVHSVWNAVALLSVVATGGGSAALSATQILAAIAGEVVVAAALVVLARTSWTRPTGRSRLLRP